MSRESRFMFVEMASKKNKFPQVWVSLVTARPRLITVYRNVRAANVPYTVVILCYHATFYRCNEEVRRSQIG